MAELKDMPLYGSGKDWEEAVEHLQYELDTLYAELIKDNNFSKEFLSYKTFFQKNLEEQ